MLSNYPVAADSVAVVDETFVVVVVEKERWKNWVVGFVVGKIRVGLMGFEKCWCRLTMLGFEKLIVVVDRLWWWKWWVELGMMMNYQPWLKLECE